MGQSCTNLYCFSRLLIPCSSLPNLLRFCGSVASRYSDPSPTAWTTRILVPISFTLWAGSMLPRLLGEEVRKQPIMIVSVDQSISKSSYCWPGCEYELYLTLLCSGRCVALVRWHTSGTGSISAHQQSHEGNSHCARPRFTVFQQVASSCCSYQDPRRNSRE